MCNRPTNTAVCWRSCDILLGSDQMLSYMQDNTAIQTSATSQLYMNSIANLHANSSANACAWKEYSNYHTCSVHTRVPT